MTAIQPASLAFGARQPIQAQPRKTVSQPIRFGGDDLDIDNAEGERRESRLKRFLWSDERKLGIRTEVPEVDKPGRKWRIAGWTTVLAGLFIGAESQGIMSEIGNIFQMIPFIGGPLDGFFSSKLPFVAGGGALAKGYKTKGYSHGYTDAQDGKKNRLERSRLDKLLRRNDKIDPDQD